MFSSSRSVALAALLMAGSTVATVDVITAKGKYLFHSNGTQFFIRGVAYQQGVGVGGAAEVAGQTFTDNLADATGCARDIPYLQQLGTNTIRVYGVDPTLDHSACMNALNNAGIYVIADLSVPGQSIERDNPTWNVDLYARYTSVINNMAQYPNTLGFFAGNEVTNNNTNTGASAFVKAAVRDSKAYIASQNYGRWLGVGYATNDDSATRDNLADYFNCGDQAASVDFWGYNIYEWCGQNTFAASGYQERTTAFQNYSVPAFFSEYGCNNPGGGASRIFQETSALYSSQMNQVWSGGIVYEYFEEQNDFGLVSVSGSTVTPQKDFAALAKEIAASGYPTTTTTINSVDTTSLTARACPAVQSGWAAAEALPPTPNSATCETMVNTLSCVPSSTLTTAQIGPLFGTVCGMDQTACTKITSNTSTGVYGEFTMCNATQQLAFALNQYYVNQKSVASACSFNGMAKLVKASNVVVSGSTLGSSSSSSSGGSSTSGSSSSSDKTSGGSSVRAGFVATYGAKFIAPLVIASATIGFTVFN